MTHPQTKMLNSLRTLYKECIVSTPQYFDMLLRAHDAGLIRTIDVIEESAQFPTCAFPLCLQFLHNECNRPVYRFQLRNARSFELRSFNVVLRLFRQGKISFYRLHRCAQTVAQERFVSRLLKLDNATIEAHCVNSQSNASI